MAEYIEREAAIRKLGGEAIAKYPASFALGIFASADEIKSIPAADVRPVVRAKWEYNGPDENVPYCSNCMLPSDEETRFCAGCGADMREANDG